jgi:hypothetical protein
METQVSNLDNAKQEARHQENEPAMEQRDEEETWAIRFHYRHSLILKGGIATIPRLVREHLAMGIEISLFKMVAEGS